MHNKLILNVLGGGNFGSSKLTSNHCVLTKGRIAAWIQALVFVLFVFSLSACSSDENTENEQKIDYKSQFSAHKWVVSEAIKRVGDLSILVNEGSAHCQFTADSVFFSEEEKVTEIDGEGKILQSYIKLSPRGSYLYTIKNDQITINGQTFQITSKDQSVLLENKKWRFVLKEESGAYLNIMCKIL